MEQFQIPLKQHLEQLVVQPELDPELLLLLRNVLRHHEWFIHSRWVVQLQAMKCLFLDHNVQILVC